MANPSTATVHLLAGLNGAGKTTHARHLEREVPAVRFTLDEWMLRLHGLPYDDPHYPELSERCQELIWDTACQVLETGTDVVLDWNQWSAARRRHWRDRITATGHNPVLHHLRVPLDAAIERLERRRREGVPGAHVLDGNDVRHLATLFEPPTLEEGLDLHLVED